MKASGSLVNGLWICGGDMITNLFVIRHGESQGNVDLDLYVKGPTPEIDLTDKGRKQVEETGEKLKKALSETYSGLHGDDQVARTLRSVVQPAMFSSPFKRTIETCRILVGKLKEADLAPPTGVYEDVLLVEQSYGAATGFDSVENFVERAHPLALRFSDERQFLKSMTSLYYQFPQGESPAQVAVRAQVFLQKILPMKVQNAVIVSHKGFCCMLEQQMQGPYGPIGEWENGEMRHYRVVPNRYNLPHFHRMDKGA